MPARLAALLVLLPVAIPPRASAQGPGTSARRPASEPRLIVCFGDSLTAGLGAPPGESYPDFLGRRLEAAGYHFRVLNRGVSGETTKDGLARLPAILALKPAIVVLAFGGNDGLRGLPLAATRSNLDAMISALRASGSQVVLGGITLPPNYGPDYIQAFDAIYADLAHRYRLRWTPFLLEQVIGRPGSMQADGIHPTAQGNAQVAENVFALLRPLLGARR
jgi:acyl-CoA thioesterase-1